MAKFLKQFVMLLFHLIKRRMEFAARRCAHFAVRACLAAFFVWRFLNCRCLTELCFDLLDMVNNLGTSFMLFTNNDQITLKWEANDAATIREVLAGWFG